jgi:hypothetical protein
MAIAANRLASHYEITIANETGRKASLPSYVRFFPFDEGVVDHSGRQESSINGDHVVVTVPVSPYESTPPTSLRGILYTTESWNGGPLKAIEIDAPIVVERPEPPPSQTTK